VPPSSRAEAPVTSDCRRIRPFPGDEPDPSSWYQVRARSAAASRAEDPDRRSVTPWIAHRITHRIQMGQSSREDSRTSPFLFHGARRPRQETASGGTPGGRLTEMSRREISRITDGMTKASPRRGWSLVASVPAAGGSPARGGPRRPSGHAPGVLPPGARDRSNATGRVGRCAMVWIRLVFSYRRLRPRRNHPTFRIRCNSDCPGLNAAGALANEWFESICVVTIDEVENRGG
jgi:hypothetical protein